MQSFRADRYRAKRVRLSAYVKSKDLGDWAGLWMRADAPGRGGVAFDNMEGRPVRGTTEWKWQEIVLDIPPTAVLIAFGLMMGGRGQMWADDFTLDVVGNDVSPTGSDVSANMGGGPPAPPDQPSEPSNLGCET